MKNSLKSRDSAVLSSRFQRNREAVAHLRTKHTAFDASPLAKRSLFSAITEGLRRFFRFLGSFFRSNEVRKRQAHRRGYYHSGRPFGKPKLFPRVSTIQSNCATTRLASRKERVYAKRGYGYIAPPSPKENRGYYKATLDALVKAEKSRRAHV